MRNLVSKSHQHLLGALFILGILPWLSACEQETQKPNVIGDSMTFPLPMQISSVDNTQNLITWIYISEVGSSAPEVKVQLETHARAGSPTVTANGFTTAFESGKDYTLQLEVDYDRSLDPQVQDIVKLFRSGDIPITIQTGPDGKLKGSADLTAGDLAKHGLFYDDDLDGYANLQEIDSSLGSVKTDIHDSFKYPGRVKSITSPHNFSFVVCPQLNAAAMTALSPPGYASTDYRGCSNDGINDIWIFDSAPANYDIIMATDFGFNNITMGHVHGFIQPFSPPFPGWSSARIYKHPGMANDNATFWGLLDTNCAPVANTSPQQWACDNVKWAQPAATNLNQAVAPMWFVSEYTRSEEQTTYLPTWTKLDSNVDEQNGSSDITISWEDLYFDTAHDTEYTLYRSNSIEPVQIDNYDTNGNVLGQVSGRQLVALDTTALVPAKAKKANDPIFNLKVDSSGQGVLTYVDKNLLGGVVYFYVIETTYKDANNVVHTNKTSPIGISTFAATRYIEGITPDPDPVNLTHPASGNIRVTEVSGGSEVSLASPVAYGTSFTYYYIPNNNTTLLASLNDLATFKSNCVQQIAPDYVGCKTATNPPNYTFTVLSSEMHTDVLMEKVDRYGRYAGHEISRF